VSSSYTYNGTIEIILALPIVGETTVLGPYNINAAVGSDTLSTTITVNPPPSSTAPTNYTPYIVGVLVIAVISIALVLYIRRR
jgi:hypothetical protein